MHNVSGLIGSSRPIVELREEVERAGRREVRVLITGESGVGKEMVAREIHQQSRRNSSPLGIINCAGVPDSLLESELFGYVRGSFTDAYQDRQGRLELAHRGTIFMDEIGEMSLRMQALLLRFLENGEIQRLGSERPPAVVDVRVISATNRTLADRITEKEFREDLYYRLKVVHVAIPPLRRRRDDIPQFVRHFLQVHATRHHLDVPEVSAEAMALMVGYDWPGNVRELRNVLEQLVVRFGSVRIEPHHLPSEIHGAGKSCETGEAATIAKPCSLMLDRMIKNGESFWDVVYGPFMVRDLTRADLRRVIELGLVRTSGRYTELVHLFNIAPDDYKRFLAFLRKHDCHVPFKRFRPIPRFLAPLSATEVAS